MKGYFLGVPISGLQYVGVCAGMPHPPLIQGNYHVVCKNQAFPCYVDSPASPSTRNHSESSLYGFFRP